jgi:hypothetical protein
MRCRRLRSASLWLLTDVVVPFRGAAGAEHSPSVAIYLFTTPSRSS